MENAVFYRQLEELFRDLNLTLHLDHLRVGQKLERKSATSSLVFQTRKRNERNQERIQSV